jgi:hypothetical protein
MAVATTGGVRDRRRAARERGGLVPGEQGGGAPDARRWYQVDLSTTPGRLRLLIAVLVLLSLAWGGLATFTANQYASAASGVVSVREPLSQDALQIYQKLSDANDTAATAFLAGGQESATTQAGYQADIDAANLAIEQAAAREGTGSGAAATDLAALTTGVAQYTQEIGTADAYNRAGVPLGAAYLREANDLMRSKLLPTAQNMYNTENARLGATSAQATGLPLVAITLALGLGVVITLLAASRWLSRRTNRLLNPGVLAAGAALAVSLLWLAFAYAGGRSELLTARAVGSAPAQALAGVSITVQQAHADESLTLIDNQGDDTYQGLYMNLQQTLGPGPGTLLTAARTVALASGPGAANALDAVAAAPAWFKAHGDVRRLDDAGNHSAAVSSVLGTTKAGTAGAQYTLLSRELGAAMTAEQGAFDTRARSGAAAFTGLEPGIIVAALVMAAGCAWGLNRRLREYR